MKQPFIVLHSVTGEFMSYQYDPMRLLIFDMIDFYKRHDTTRHKRYVTYLEG